MVDYIFTDKTGTLTLNKMDFKYCIIGNSCYKYSKYEDKSVLKDKNDEFEDSVLIEEKLMKSKTTRFGKNYFCNLKNSAVAQEKIFNNYKIISNSNPKINILIEMNFL